jgi:YVTN family beta-propeller protein
MRNRKLITILLALLVLTLAPLSLSNSVADLTSAEKKMRLLKTIVSKDISPKSVRASKTGFVSAHNMMYRHSVTVYDAETLELVKNISDQVNLKEFGLNKYQGLHRGSPVEGAFSPDGEYLYVTNYAMYGKGFNREGTDKCSPSDNYDRSFLYRIKTSSWKIDGVYRVGVVPKVVEVSPDNKFVLVTNWCSYDLSVISLAEQKVVKTIKIGAYPRGIAISRDSQFAYIVQMGGSVVHKITLGSWERELLNVGANPRAVVLSPDDSKLYITLNAAGRVIAYDLEKKKVIRGVKTGNAARSVDISTDGTALYVVNYRSGTVSKIRESDFKVLQNIKVCSEPIGITYEPVYERTWVACYGGAIKIFSDRP